MLVAFCVGDGGGDVALQQAIVLGMLQDQILLDLIQKFTHRRHLQLSGSGSHLHDLDRFGQDQLGIHTLGSQEADLASGGVQLVQATEGDALAVTDPVILQITEGHDLLTGTDAGNSNGGVHRTAQQSIGSAFLQSGLPQILAILVLQQTDGVDGGVVQQPDGLLAVRRTQAVVEVDDLVGGDFGSRSGSQTQLCTFVIAEQTSGLAVAVAGDEGQLFCIGDTAGELTTEIVLQIEGGVVEQLLGDLDEGGQLVSADMLLAEGLGGLGDLILILN